jgi:hypothetical protein
LQYSFFSGKEILISTRRIPIMAYEGLLLLIGTFLVLAIGFWRAAERPKNAQSEPQESRSPELHRPA